MKKFYMYSIWTPPLCWGKTKSLLGKIFHPRTYISMKPGEHYRQFHFRKHK